MAKKKKKKEAEKKKFEYSNEVIGIILILASIIGIGAYGPAGNFIRAFAIFLVGNIYVFLLAGVLILGGYLIVKRKMPDFFNLRWIGFYIIVISFLILYFNIFSKDSKLFLITPSNFSLALSPNLL